MTPEKVLRIIFASCLIQDKNKKDTELNQRLFVRSTGLEPVPSYGHAPQTCAYANSATTAEQHALLYRFSIFCQHLFFGQLHHVIYQCAGRGMKAMEGGTVPVSGQEDRLCFFIADTNFPQMQLPDGTEA